MQTWLCSEPFPALEPEVSRAEKLTGGSHLALGGVQQPGHGRVVLLDGVLHDVPAALADPRQVDHPQMPIVTARVQVFRCRAQNPGCQQGTCLSHVVMVPEHASLISERPHSVINAARVNPCCREVRNNASLWSLGAKHAACSVLSVKSYRKQES